MSKLTEPSISIRARAPRKPTRRTDPRSLRSRDLLKNALLRLIEDNPLDKITLRDITSTAGVSYPTVFNHYDDKDDLFQDIARQEVMDLLIMGFRHGIGSPAWRPGAGICAYVMKRRSLWQTLLTTGASDAMRSEFIRGGRDLAGGRASLGNGFPIDVVSGVIASGTFEIIAWWLMQDADYPVSTISNMLETLVIEPALDLPPGYFTGRADEQEQKRRIG